MEKLRPHGRSLNSFMMFGCMRKLATVTAAVSNSTSHQVFEANPRNRSCKSPKILYVTQSTRATPAQPATLGR